MFRKMNKPSSSATSLFFIGAMVFSTPVLADIVFDFTGKDTANKPVKGVLTLKDSYKFGGYANESDFVSFTFFDSKGKKHAFAPVFSQNTNAMGVVNFSINLSATPQKSNRVGLYEDDQSISAIVSTSKNGEWQVFPSDYGASAQWKLRQKGKRAIVDCLKGDLLHKASAKGDVAFVSECLKTHDVNTPEGNGWTPLHAAAKHGQVAVINVLLKNNAEHMVYDNNGKTPLDIALGSKQTEAIAILRKLPQPPSLDLAIPTEPTEITGGNQWENIDIQDPAMIEVARFVAAQIRKKESADFLEGDNYLHGVDKASRKMLAGIHYRLTMGVINNLHDMDAATYEVEVSQAADNGMKIVIDSVKQTVPYK